MRDLRQLADEIGLKIHLGTMEARDAWHALQPRLSELERHLEGAGKRVGEAVDHEVEVVARALRKIRDDLNDS